jgi:hypothetical protein
MSTNIPILTKQELLLLMNYLSNGDFFLGKICMDLN